MSINALRTAYFQMAARFRRCLGRRRHVSGEAELLAMDDRELRDIAIGRGEIPYFLAKERQAPRSSS
ncbi:DUF1127 domain-containing protein [Roseateles sp.]|uniref:DUF1127 domain-containing protein n=1 Tax=Roseateles sp. TaxID=1971397 RepID=UPI0039EC1375